MSKKYYSSSRRSEKFAPWRAQCELLKAASATADTSSPPSFTKVLMSEYQIHTSIRQCALILPKYFCDEHKVARHVTMTDSTGLTLWHLLCGNKMAEQGMFKITNGWREFSYDHGLKLNDRLLFTLVSPSHFVVEFAASKGLTRALRPIRDGKEYPWPRGITRLAWRRYSEKVQAGMSKQKSPEDEILWCQCGSAKIEKQKKQDGFPELIHLECKNHRNRMWLRTVANFTEK